MPRAAPTSARATKSPNALEVLKADHEEVTYLFTQFEKCRKGEDAEGMQEIAEAVCSALAVHAWIEEEIFYPGLRNAIDADDALDEAIVEHAHVKELVAQLAESQPGDDLFEARFKVLSEYVRHHVAEEEGTIFSKARESGVDLAALGERLEARKAELGAADPDLDALAAHSTAMSRRNGRSATR